MAKTISGLIKDYFDKHSNKDISHDEVVDYIFKSFPKARDPWRAVRKLYGKEKLWRDRFFEKFQREDD